MADKKPAKSNVGPVNTLGKCVKKHVKLFGQLRVRLSLLQYLLWLW